MKPVLEVPPVEPDKPAAEASNAIYITLGRKRYKIDIKVSAEELKPKPAPIIPIK
jgi:hypothetical protein